VKKYLIIHVCTCRYKIVTVKICNLCLCVEICLFLLNLNADVCILHVLNCSLRLLLTPGIKSKALFISAN
jgi:hypothetical protein